eukprot:10272218-Alexandrium_andersonii.AAC.1
MTSLRRGDVIALLAPCRPEAGSLAAQQSAPDQAHVVIVIDDLGLERMLELELPLEAYYEALFRDLQSRFPLARPHVVGHL